MDGSMGILELIVIVERIFMRYILKIKINKSRSL
jgi:hypothetical protein